MQAGTFLVRAVRDKSKIGRSNNGNAQIGVPLCITESGPERNKLITWYGSLAQGEAMRITREALITLGWDGTSSLSSLNGLGTKDAEAVIVWDEYNGEQRLKVKAIREPGSVFFAGGEIGDSDISDLDKLMANAANQPRTARGPRPQRRQPAGEWDGTGRHPYDGGGGGGGGGGGRPPRGGQDQNPGPRQDGDDVPSENEDDIPFASSAFTHDPMLKVYQ